MFDENFRVCFADTPFGVALHQRIRYQVFCLDKGFEDPSAFSTAQETDAWDDQSAHFIVQNKKTLQWVAATRIVLPKRGRPLPVDSLGAFDRHRLDPPLSRVGRFRAFASSQTRRWWKPTRWQYRSPTPSRPGDRRNRSQSAVRGHVGDDPNADHIFAETRLDQLCDVDHRCIRTVVAQAGVTLRQVGPVTEHRGMRTAYLVDMRESALSMTKKSTAVRDLFKRSKHAYVRISSVSSDDTVDYVSEFAPITRCSMKRSSARRSFCPPRATRICVPVWVSRPLLMLRLVRGLAWIV
ncbi:MAG: GNAT family N-acetyltransferase [Chromatiaceae bacterium]|nr:GNAT family N-acetyltransferase [Chromatiaceae bacterium]